MDKFQYVPIGIIVVSSMAMIASLVFIRLITAKIRLLTLPLETESMRTYCIFTLRQYQLLRIMHVFNLFYRTYFIVRYAYLYHLLNQDM